MEGNPEAISFVIREAEAQSSEATSPSFYNQEQQHLDYASIYPRVHAHDSFNTHLSAPAGCQALCYILGLQL